MFYQDRVVGTLVTVTPATAGVPVGDSDVDVLAVLANNAAIAMENARLFEQERDTVRRLLELDSMKTDFLATVQHELRTPLTAILGLADLLEMCWDMWEEGPKLDAVRDIQVAAKNLYDIVETIIDYSVMEDEKLGLNPTPVPLRETIENTLALVGERYRGGLPVPVDVVGDASVTVFADAERLVQVVRAVLDNAVKFSDGRGRVTVSFAPVDEGREVRIEIGDQGIGIPADDLSRIFDRFYQVDNTATRKYGGTGMGLALVKRMVDAHGARVEVESTVGEGTRFIITWPASAAAASGEARAVAEAGSSRREALCTRLACRYNERGRARWGVSGALNPQSAIAGSNSPPRGRGVGSAPSALALTTGSYAARVCEPRQVRKEAAVNGPPGVPWQTWSELNDRVSAGVTSTTWGARLPQAAGAAWGPRCVLQGRDRFSPLVRSK